MKKAVIIGAGPAGLTAGYELLKEGGYEVLILEKSDRIGGISQTVSYQANRMDIGGHRFFSKDERVNNWWQTFLPLQGAPSYDDRVLNREYALAEGGPNPEDTDQVMLQRRRVSRIYYQNHFFDYPVSLKWSTLKNMGLRTTIRTGLSYLHAVFFKLPEDNLENFYINRFGKVLYTMFFEGYTEKLWGRHPREISADWGSQRVKGLSVTAVLKDIIRKIMPKKSSTCETSLIEEFRYPKYGPGQLWETVADEIVYMGGTILLDNEVKDLLIENGQITQVSCLEDGVLKVYRGDLFISSMPVKDLIAGIQGRHIPKEVQTAAAQLPFRDFVTVGLLVDQLNLKNTTKIKTLGDIVPDCWIYVQDTGVKLGRIQIFNNWSPYMVDDPLRHVWIGLEYFCQEGDDFWNMSEDECIAFAARELISMGVIQADAVLDAHRERVQKAYPAYFDGYQDMDKIISFLNTIPNLYCVGRNGQHRYNNMDHSMVTSFEAVHNIVYGVSDKSNIWNVNTEKDYHEKK